MEFVQFKIANNQYSCCKGLQLNIDYCMLNIEYFLSQQHLITQFQSKDVSTAHGSFFAIVWLLPRRQ